MIQKLYPRNILKRTESEDSDIVDCVCNSSIPNGPKKGNPSVYHMDGQAEQRKGIFLPVRKRDFGRN